MLLNFALLKRSVTVCSLLLLSASTVHSQTLEYVLSQLESPQVEVRTEAFYRLLGHRKVRTTARWVRPDSSTQRLLRNRPADAGRITASLIVLLERENKRPLGEEDATYHGDLINSVAGLRNPLAVEALLGAIATGRIAREGLVQISSVAIPRLLTMADRDTSGTNRLAAVAALGEIAKRQTETGTGPGTMEAIRRTLMSALDESDDINRGSAISALGAFPNNPLVRASIARIAKEDTVRFVDSQGRERFPVRERAASWLRTHGNR